MIRLIVRFLIVFLVLGGCDGGVLGSTIPSQASFLLTVDGNPVSSLFFHENSTSNIILSGGSGNGGVSWIISDPTVATLTVVGNQATITPLKSGKVSLSIVKESDGNYARQMRIYPLTISYLTGSTWTRTATDIAGSIHSGRKNFVSFSDITNTLWVMGGMDASSVALNDIWKSSDGIIWTQVIPSSSYWEPRTQFEALATSDGNLWVLGGYDGQLQYNDVWKSSDGGKNWTKISEGSYSEVQAGTHWSARDDHVALAESNGTLWILGGFSDTARLNDIWKSVDGGQIWTKITPSSSHWTPRSNHAAFLSGTELWVLGGSEGIMLKNDIWKSTDGGETWVEIVPIGSYWSARDLHKAFTSSAGSIIWVIAGYDGSRKGDIWKSYDQGTTWTQLSISGSYWTARDRFDAFVTADGSTIWLMGGVGSDSIQRDDVWKSQ